MVAKRGASMGTQVNQSPPGEMGWQVLQQNTTKEDIYIANYYGHQLHIVASLLQD